MPASISRWRAAILRAMPYVMIDTSDGVAQLTLNDPDRRNAVGQAMNDEIVAALDELEPDPSIGALVVSGAGKGFCAGAVLDPCTRTGAPS